VTATIKYIPYSWHEEIAMAFNIEANSSGNMLLLRDPIDRLVDELNDYLDKNGNTEKITFEEWLFKTKNPVARLLGITSKEDISDFYMDYEYLMVSDVSEYTGEFERTPFMPITFVKTSEQFNTNTVFENIKNITNLNYIPTILEKKIPNSLLDVGIRGDLKQFHDIDFALLSMTHTTCTTGIRPLCAKDF
jgi:hypothetical protein